MDDGIERARNIARCLRKELNLSIPVSAAQVARELGISVQYVNIKGPAALWVPNQALILINKKAWHGRRNFSCGHEIGHALLHEGQYTYAHSTDHEKKEQEANVFATNLLMPAEEIRRLRSTLKVYELAALFKVSEQAMRIRLRQV